MITKAQALAVDYRTEIHYTGRHSCTRVVGPRGGVKVTITVCRVNGRCQTWKTRPEDFRLPVKHGLRDCAAIDRHNAAEWHLASECPLNAASIACPEQETSVSERREVYRQCTKRPNHDGPHAFSSWCLR